MKKPAARGPTASEKARKALGNKLNRPTKLPPLLNDVLPAKKAPPAEQRKIE